MRDAFVRSIIELAERDTSVILITADLGFGIFDEYVSRFPNQFLNVGVAEQNMVGVATGLGLEGKKIFTYSIGNFATLRCLEQIRNDAAYHNVNLTVVASGGGFTYGALGMSHHATEDIAIMRALPNVKVVVPSSAWEAYYATKALAADSGVGYLRIEKGGDQDPPFVSAKFRIGKSLTLREGKDIAIICAGGIAEECHIAASRLSEIGISATIVSMHTIKPIDKDIIKKCAKYIGKIITVEEHNTLGGLGGAVAEVLACQDEKCKFKIMGLKDQYSSVVGDQKFLREYYALNSDAIVDAVMHMR